MTQAIPQQYKHLLLDSDLVLQSWLLEDESIARVMTLLETASSTGARLWIAALAIPGVQQSALQSLERNGIVGDAARHRVAQNMSGLFEQVDVLTCYGFELKAAYANGQDFAHAQLAAAAATLPKGRTCFVTDKKSGNSVHELPCWTPEEALDWLRKDDSAHELDNDISFVDLGAQQARMRPALEEGIERVLRHGRYILGPEVAELEERLADFVGVKHCITCANGTDALQIAQMALGIGSGDEVITPGFGFIATAETIALLGAKPVFVDIDPCTCNIDAARIEDSITDKTRAIMPVSLYGQPADIDEINAVAARHDLPVIEDGAQSFGATYKGRKSCGFTTIGTTSFFPTKPLGGYGDSGACFTDDEILARRMREIRAHGQDRRYHHDRLGVNSRMDTLQAAILLAKLDSFPEEVALRQQAAVRYNTLFAPEDFGKSRKEVTLECPSSAAANRVTPPWVAPDCTSVYAQYTVQVPDREAVQVALKTTGAPTAVHYPMPLYRQPAFGDQENEVADFPYCEAASERVLSLPMHPYLTESEQRRVAGALLAAHGH